MKRTKKVFLTLMVCLISVFALAFTSEAASKAPTCKKSITAYYMKDRNCDCVCPQGEDACNIEIKNLSKNATITNIKSSNPKIASVYSVDNNVLRVAPTQWVNERKIHEVLFDWKVVEGTTKISFTVTQNGHKYNLSCKYTVKKQPSPLKSFKVNGKQYTSRLKGTDGEDVHIKTGTSKAKISFSGVNLKKAKITVQTYNTSASNNYKEKTLKNNSTISIPKNGYVCITISGKFPSGHSIRYAFSLSR